jgi:hypothetical protein
MLAVYMSSAKLYLNGQIKDEICGHVASIVDDNSSEFVGVYEKVVLKWILKRSGDCLH